MKINHLKLFTIIALFSSYQQMSRAQATLNSNTLTGTVTAPAQYLGSSSNHDVILKSNTFERLRFTAGTSTASNMQLHTSTTFLGAVGGIKLLGAQGHLATAPAYSFNADAGLGMFRPTSNAIAFSTASVERLRITSGGSIGIGNTAPTATLDVKGTGKFSTNITAPLLLFNTNNGFSWTQGQGANANVGTFLYGKVVSPSLPATGELTSTVKHKFAGGIKLFETDVNGGFPANGSQLNIQSNTDGYSFDIAGLNKKLMVNAPNIDLNGKVKIGGGSNYLIFNHDGAQKFWMVLDI